NSRSRRQINRRRLTISPSSFCRGKVLKLSLLSFCLLSIYLSVDPPVLFLCLSFSQSTYGELSSLFPRKSQQTPSRVISLICFSLSFVSVFLLSFLFSLLDLLALPFRSSFFPSGISLCPPTLLASLFFPSFSIFLCFSLLPLCSEVAGFF
ncbi:hypothetical protein CSUI_008090, partial [Cystoisospora suis]